MKFALSVPDLKKSLYLTITVWVKRLPLLASHPFLKNLGHLNLLEIPKNVGIDNQLKYFTISKYIDAVSPDFRLLCAFFLKPAPISLKVRFFADLSEPYSTQFTVVHVHLGFSHC